jgi:hypothetical protein
MSLVVQYATDILHITFIEIIIILHNYGEV